jgi:hypothetical protein
MSKKNSSEQEALRKRVYEFYKANQDHGKKYSVDHFIAEKVAKSTIYDIIQRAESDSGYERVIGSGAPAKKMTKSKIKRLKGLFDIIKTTFLNDDRRLVVSIVANPISVRP